MPPRFAPFIATPNSGGCTGSVEELEDKMDERQKQLAEAQEGFGEALKNRREDLAKALIGGQSFGGGSRGFLVQPIIKKPGILASLPCREAV
jgi:hypothetical protein